jgi:hypothetical protein
MKCATAMAAFEVDLAEIANGISKTETAIRRCREILDDLQEPKTVGTCRCDN